MSATIGTGLSRTMSRSAREEASSGTETRTMSAPASAQASTWAMVAAASEVSVLVMVCTEIGASPPTGTGPTMIRRVSAALDAAPGADGVERHGHLGETLDPGLGGSLGT